MLSLDIRGFAGKMTTLAPTVNEQGFWCPVGTTPLTGDKPKILMCPPDYFTVEYAINPWMEGHDTGSCDVELAKKQWENLYKAISEEAGAEVLLMDPVDGLPDLVFTANAAFVYNEHAVIAHYKFPERQGEEPHCEKWFNDHGFTVTTMPDNIFFEGAGDALTWKTPEDNVVVFSGYRSRTDIASHSLMSAKTGLPVMSLELGERFYHVDVTMCPLATGDLIYYPGAYDEYGNAVIEANVPKEKRIPVSKEEAYRFCCNTVNINDTVIFNEGSSKLADELKARGIRVLQVNMSEFLKSGGSSKCLTLRVG